VTGLVDSFTVSPALPAGLSLNKTTGAVTGTPSTATASAVYVVSARNPAGAATVNLTLTVYGPPVITYATQTASYPKGSAIASNTVTASPSGTIDSFTVAPALPAGLSINKSSGAISGTPTAASSPADYVVTAWNKAGTGKDTLNLQVTDPGTTITLSPAKDVSLDTSNGNGYNTGFSGFSYFAKTGQPYIALWQFDLSSQPATGLKSAKVRFRTYGYGPVWTGTPQTVTAKVYRVKSSWVEGHGNWYWNNNAWHNNGNYLYANYPLTPQVRDSSVDPAVGDGLRYTDQAIIRPANLILAETQSLSVNYSGASVHPNFTTAVPAPANLVDLEIDMTDYVKGVLDGSYADYGFTVYMEGLGTDASNFIGVLNKEMGDGSSGARLILQY
jgi:hypothetical protein